MKLTLLGYGKMGKAVEAVATGRGHEIAAKLSEGWSRDEIPADTDVVVEFTRPDEAQNNILRVLDLGLPIVSGTTGWLDKGWDEVVTKVNEKKGALFYASNFSIGVYLFRLLVRELSVRMNAFPDFSGVSMEEVHHIHKLDYPSGTALTVAKEDILGVLDRKSLVKAYLSTEPAPDLGEDADQTLLIKSVREGEVSGIHRVEFLSPGVEAIRIEHESLSRESLAKGAVLAAEFVRGKKGVFGMSDLMGKL